MFSFVDCAPSSRAQLRFVTVSVTGFWHSCLVQDAPWVAGCRLYHRRAEWQAMQIPADQGQGRDTCTPSSVSSPTQGIESHTLPRHIDLLQLNELNWSQLAGHKEPCCRVSCEEWRTTLHLRNLTWKLCDEDMLRSFLERSGLMKSIAKIRVKPGRGHGSGSATLYVKTDAWQKHVIFVGKVELEVDEVSKVAKFFHGRQFPGSLEVHPSG
eukprot:Skav215034  [mRNA]  locus=scaffold4428:75405:79834:+ [translate_table: standard]